MTQNNTRKLSEKCAKSVPLVSYSGLKSLYDTEVKLLIFIRLVVLVARLELARTYKVPRILSSAFNDLSTILNVDNFFFQNPGSLENRVFKTSFQVSKLPNLTCLKSNQKYHLRGVSVPKVCHGETAFGENLWPA